MIYNQVPVSRDQGSGTVAAGMASSQGKKRVQSSCARVSSFSPKEYSYCSLAR